ncbi:hypothetical protein V6B16_03765 [Salinimicrobium catena]|uniref:hypothetical protein n=1 Tax=Salinimicrobium catena TaxID=390640 RepID=UPI002FE46380
MKKILRKGETYIGIQYDSGDFSNNLYCSTSLYSNDVEKIIELDFSKINNARIRTDSNDDLESLMENSDKISQIDFSDKQITGKLIRNGIKQNEILLVEFVSKEKRTDRMQIVFSDLETFKLVKN